MTYRLTPEADADIFEIWCYIASDSIDAANRVEAAIYRSCALLASGPFRGHERKDLTRLPLRFWTVQPYRKYVIVYDPAMKPVQIIRVLHGGRNAARLLLP